MRTQSLAMILGAALCLPGVVLAKSEKVEPGDPPIMKPMLVATEAEVIQFDQRGEIVWRTPSGVARDVWQLENGNVLFPFNQEGSCGVREVALSGETVWEYKLPGQYVISCQRLKDGNTLVGASCRGAVLVVNPQGEIVHSIKLRATHKKHSATIARQLDNGHILVVEESTRFVAEYTLNGDLVWEMETPFSPFGAQRLKNGHTLISGQTGLIEVTPKKHIVWRLASEDVKEMGPRWFAGFRLLPNGNIMVCNAGGTVPFFEVNRQKQVVWHTGLTKKQVGIAHGLYVLGEQHGGGPSGLGAALAAARNGACSRVSRPRRSALAYSIQTAIFGSARSVYTTKEKEVSLYGSFNSP